MERKYEFTGETRTLDNGIIVRQIRRLSDGELGGYIETEDNLSHTGTCWISEDSIAYGSCRVSEKATFSLGRIEGSGDYKVYHSFGPGIWKWLFTYKE